MPSLLDTFCGQGGAGMGYRRAGFDVTGVDDRPQPRYPFAFILADALEFILAHGHEFDVIHASPPCHDHSALRAPSGRDWSDYLLWDTRIALQRSGRRWVIENVPGADMPGAIRLCGSMFGLGAHGAQLRRHRKFESNVAISPPGPCRHEGPVIGVYGGGPTTRGRGPQRGGYQGTVAERVEAMGVDWMTREGLSQAVPPAYTEWVGRQLWATL
jgi:DNA (cytosine-5)-methyltransferase 1